MKDLISQTEVIKDGLLTGTKKTILNRMIDMPDRHIDNIITSKNIKIMNVNAPLTSLNDFDHLPVIAD